MRRGFECPSCGSQRSRVLDRKLLVTTLRRCSQCELLFRAPTTSEAESNQFYQSEYAQGFTTDIPSEKALAGLLAAHFQSTNKDYTRYIELLHALGVASGQRVIDYGCSWGYGTWQLQRAGYEMQGFEVSQPRCAFARDRLGLDAVATTEDLRPPFDCFFCAHVVEHVPNVRETLELARCLLRPDGLLVFFTPNGSESNRRTNPHAWHTRWGFVHPQLLDERFCRRNFTGRPYLVSGSPFDPAQLSAWKRQSSVELSMNGEELLLVLVNSK